ncbi:hypothetical protein [Arthrobacter sp. 24S4-2]|uniref:hypothetical protein n=1 Tax=Arthrobacter sp. 24S4-2 TaxID=2575374 RepID=UPI001C30E1AD|nr:hypothetical protein [Arthrobacter sp. 24S4-2]
MICVRCGSVFTDGRRDRLYCRPNCRKRASEIRCQTGTPPPPRWRHPALGSEKPALRLAAARAEQVGQAHGWSPATFLYVLDGLTLLLNDRAPGDTVPLTEVRHRASERGRGVRIAEVLAAAGLLDDDTEPAIRSWIHRRTNELPAAFASDVRAWLLVLLDGDTRSRPRSPRTVYSYFGSVRPLLEQWSASRGHLREITSTDIATAIEPLRGWPRSNTITALRSLFRFATRRRVVFTNPTARLTNPGGERSLLPMTDAEIRAIETRVTTPAQRLVVALAAVHAADATTIRGLILDDVDLPNRRITLRGVAQPLGPLAHRALKVWTEHRRSTWPHTPNPHLLISRGTAHGVGSVSQTYITDQLLPDGVGIDRIRNDRILHEALSIGPDPLHLALIFNIGHTTASRYTAFAQAIT